MRKHNTVNIKNLPILPIAAVQAPLHCHLMQRFAKKHHLSIEFSFKCGKISRMNLFMHRQTLL